MDILTNPEGRERKIEIELQKKDQILAFWACVKNISKKIRLVKKYAFFLAKLAILMLISQKPVQRRGMGKKRGFFATRWL